MSPASGSVPHSRLLGFLLWTFDHFFLITMGLAALGVIELVVNRRFTLLLTVMLLVGAKDIDIKGATYISDRENRRTSFRSAVCRYGYL